MPNDIHPKWWQLYLTFPLLIALFLLESRLKISARGHQAVQIGILLLVYGLVHLWLRSNATAISKMDQSPYREKITVIQIPPAPLPDANQEKRPIFQFRDSEIKGVLNDTFEMDYIDAESYPIDEEDIDKE